MDVFGVGQRIRLIRLKRGFTQEMLAEAAELSAPYVSHIERGTKKASLESLLRIAAALEVTVDHLLAEVQVAGTDAFVPEVCELLQDCSASERHVIFETTRAVKQALREHLKN